MRDKEKMSITHYTAKDHKLRDDVEQGMVWNRCLRTKEGQELSFLQNLDLLIQIKIRHVLNNFSLTQRKVVVGLGVKKGARRSTGKRREMKLQKHGSSWPTKGGRTRVGCSAVLG